MRKNIKCLVACAIVAAANLIIGLVFLNKSIFDVIPIMLLMISSIVGISEVVFRVKTQKPKTLTLLYCFSIAILGIIVAFKVKIISIFEEFVIFKYALIAALILYLVVFLIISVSERSIIQSEEETTKKESEPELEKQLEDDEINL